MEGEGRRLSEQDMSLIDRIRELDAEVLEEESESDEENERQWRQVPERSDVNIRTLGSEHTVRSTERRNSNNALLEAELQSEEARDRESSEQEESHREGESLKAAESPKEGESLREGDSSKEGESPKEGGSPIFDSERGRDHEEEESSRYDGLYRAYLQRQQQASTEVQFSDSPDAFEISQPDSDSQQQAEVMTHISEREQQFLASIRQLDQVELEEEEMSETEESDGDADSPGESPREEGVPRGAFTFDTSLPALHTYLGDFDDVAGGRAFEEGGSLISLPIFYLDGVVLFPGDSLPLRVLQPRFQSAVRRAMRQTTHACTIGVVYYRGLFHPEGQGVANVGTTAEIRQVKEQDDGTFNIVAKGRQRFNLRRLTVEPDNSPSAQVEIIPEDKLLHMPHSAFSRLAAWPSLQSGHVPSALELPEPAGDSPELTPRTYSRSPRRGSTGISSRREPLDVSPTSAPSRSRRRVSFRGGAAAGKSLDVFDFSAEKEASASKEKSCESTPDWLKPPAVKKSHVTTPRSELFLPAYKRRKQKGAVQSVREEERFLPKISWPEICPVRFDLAAEGATRHALLSSADITSLLPSQEVLGSTFAEPSLRGLEATESGRGLLSSQERWDSTFAEPSHRGPEMSDRAFLAEASLPGTGARGLFPGHRRAVLGKEQAPGGSNPSHASSRDQDSKEEWQGVSKAWAADDATWRSRAPLSAWPYWVYRMHDAYALSRRVADLMRQVVPARAIDTLLHEPEAMSYYVASNLPLQDESRQALLESSGTVYRLRKEIRILEVLDKLRCKACEHLVGSKADLMVMSADGPIGAYVNAHGHIHETLTLRKVQNLELEGSPETENSWFPGYAWTIAHCSNCGYHMGWKFTATKQGMVPDSFWGITRAHLADSMAFEDHVSAGQLNFQW